MAADNPLVPAGILTVADVVRFQYFHFVRRLWPLLAFLMLFSLFGIAAVLSKRDPERLRNPGLFYVEMLILILLWTGVPYLTARRQYAKRRYLHEPVRYHFTDDRLRVEGPSFSTELTWPLVHCVYETKRAFLIYESNSHAWILPKRFFWGEEREVQRWRTFAVGHLKQPRLFRRPEALGAWF